MGIFSFIGGLIANNQRKKAARRAEWMNSPQGIRFNAEAAGFNPLVFAGPGTGTGAGYTPVFGDGIESALRALDEGLTVEKQLKLENEALKIEREKLNERIDKQILRPRVPGVYGDRHAGTNVRSRKVGEARSVSSNSGDTALAGVKAPDSIGSTAPLAPGRDLKVEKYSSGAGLTEISNRGTDFLGGPIVVPGADGEPWGIDEFGMAVVAGVPQLVARGAAKAMYPGDLARSKNRLDEHVRKKRNDKKRAEKKRKEDAKKLHKRQRQNGAPGYRGWIDRRY